MNVQPIQVARVVDIAKSRDGFLCNHQKGMML